LTPVNDRTPEFKKAAFNCPSCEAYAAQNWRSLHFSGSGGQSGVELATCRSCGRASVWLDVEDAVMIWPVGLGGPPPSEDMPAAVATIYDEARSIANLSPRSASALMRLALEALLTELYPDAGNLNDTIGAAAADGLARPIINAMDVLRFSGNASIHEISREDTPETVNALASILNLVVERLITEPKQIAAMHAQLPPGVLAQIEKRDGA